MWTCFCFADNIVHSVPGSTKDIYVWLGNTNTTDGRSKVTKSPAGWCQRVTVRLFPAFSVFLSLMKTCDCGGPRVTLHCTTDVSYKGSSKRLFTQNKRINFIWNFINSVWRRQLVFPFKKETEQIQLNSVFSMQIKYEFMKVTDDLVLFSITF